MVAGTAGRRGVGTVNHCIHGKDAVVEEVLDWEPFDHVTYRSLLPIPNVPKLVNGYVFEDLGDGRTRVEIRLLRPRSAKDRAIAESLLPGFDGMFAEGLAALKPLVEADAASAREADEANPPEPALPSAQARYLREPIVQAG